MTLDSSISGAVSEVLYGHTVVDPYRWLEDRTLPETSHWIYEQQGRCHEYFAACANFDALRARVRECLDIEVLDQPFRLAGRYFYRRRHRGEEQASICERNIATGEECVLVGPPDSDPFTSLSIYRISHDGSLLAYERRRGGEDKSAVGFVDIRSGQKLSEVPELGHARGLVFRPRGDGVYYCHESPTGSEEHVVRLRYFGETAAGRVILRLPRSEQSRLILTGDGFRLGVLWLHRSHSGTVSEFFVATIEEEMQWTRVFSDRDPSFHPFLHHDRIFAKYISNDPYMEISEFSSEGQKIRTILSGASIRQIAIANDRIYVNCLEDGFPRISCSALSGEKLGWLDAPSDGTLVLLPGSGTREPNVFYTYESFEQPPAIFEYFAGAGHSVIWHQQLAGTPHSAANLRRVSFPSFDRTEIPLTLVSPADDAPDRPRPTLLTSYGGFGASMTPRFSVLATLMRESGTALAIAHIRGGGEFGKPWHEAGRRQNRQNAIADFIAAAEWLCARGITSPEQLGIFGGSNAGLLVAAAVTQRPDLFRAVLCIAPLLDMVRYEQFDAASRWRDEYGTVENEDDFHALHAYSPYHRLNEDVDYPPIMFVSGDKDDRCNPAHVRKMAARLQCRPVQKSPVIVDYSEERGHMPVLPLSARVEALARRIAFLHRELNLAPPSGGPA